MNNTQKIEYLFCIECKRQTQHADEKCRWCKSNKTSNEANEKRTIESIQKKLDIIQIEIRNDTDLLSKLVTNEHDVMKLRDERTTLHERIREINSVLSTFRLVENKGMALRNRIRANKTEMERLNYRLKEINEKKQN